MTHPQHIGQSDITYKQSSSILSKASGFIDAFDYTLNPYTGCTFGCSYCYAAFFARDRDLQARWGHWLQVKANALDLLKKKRKRPLVDKAIYMSSVTDPYQPVEKELELTRAILQELLAYHQVRLVIQTRGTLVTRDIDLLSRFDHAQVNMTITTDDHDVRRAFEPLCPSTAQRLDAIRQINAAGIQAAITMTPLLPVRDPEQFAADLQATGVQRFVVQYFHATKSRFVAGTGAAARAISAQMGWDETRYAAVKAILKSHLPELREGKAGFTPYWME